MKVPKHAQIKFNGGRGALLCNKCNHIIREDFDPKTIEDKEYICDRCEFNASWIIRGLVKTPTIRDDLATECVKGMTHDTCPYNPLLGCDCGYNKPRKIRSEGQ